jgi:hypothetical protein
LRKIFGLGRNDLVLLYFHHSRLYTDLHLYFFWIFNSQILLLEKASKQIFVEVVQRSLRVRFQNFDQLADAEQYDEPIL